MFKQHLDKNNLHHAYLLEGNDAEILPELNSFFEGMEIKVSGNPDFYSVKIDNFKIDDALDLRSMGSEKSFSAGKDSKKIFIVSLNQITREAEGVLLKMFEEPAVNTHFFIIVPDKDILLKTIFSRFYFIPTTEKKLDIKEAEKFIAMPLSARITFLKELLDVEEDEDAETVSQNSARTKASSFLNSLEIALYNKLAKNFDPKPFDQIFQVREFLRQPGSSVKTLMESVALIVPNL